MTIEKALEAGKEDKRKAVPDASLAPGHVSEKGCWRS